MIKIYARQESVQHLLGERCRLRAGVISGHPRTHGEMSGLLCPQKYLYCLLYSKSYKRVAQALVATRNGLRGLLERTTVATEEEARSLEKFKEQKMGQVNQKIAIFRETIL